MTVRLQKFLADAGVASRRAGEEMILAGRITVNGELVRKLGTKVDPVADRVCVDRQPVKARRKLYIALHKPPGYLSTRRDPQLRKTVGDLLPAEWRELYPVGRLDKDSEGLLLLTNDGQFCLKLTHPRFGVRKIYRVTVEGRVERSVLARCLEGVQDAGEQLKTEKARLVSTNNTQSVLELELAEGKNREVRRLLAVLGLTVTRLQRTQIGKIKLGELRPGRWRALTEQEIKLLLGGL